MAGLGATFRPNLEERGSGMSIAAIDIRDWQLRAACRGPAAEFFYPPVAGEARDQRRRREQRAKELCRNCGVRTECLDYAMRTEEPHGVWGGLNEHERRALRVH